MGKSLDDKIKELPQARRERILAEADRLYAEYVKIQELLEPRESPVADGAALCERAERGDADAQHDLGLVHEFAQGGDRDYKTAAKWYKRAARQGHAAAQFSLGWAYYNGDGVRQSYKAAVQWFTRAAGQGNAMATAFLGVMYEFGGGVGEDHKTAMQWYTRAAEQGSALAQRSLAEMGAGEGLALAR